MNTKLDSLALGYTGAILSSLGMILLWILGTSGYYMDAVVMMSGWHMLFSLSVVGLIGGTIEAGVWSFVVLYIFGVIYNKFAK